MVTIKFEFENSFPNYNFYNFLKENTWSGAADRVKEMSMEELDKMLNFLEMIEFQGTITELNDFIWFEWDEIKNDSEPF